MRKLVLVLGTVVAIGLVSSATVFAGTIFKHQESPQASVATVQLNADTIFNLVNKQRTDAGLKPLVRDTALNSTAQFRADDMNNRKYFSHFDPIDGHKMIDDQNPECSGFSENILDDINETGDGNISTVASWLASKSHHDAIFDTRNVYTGVAVSGTKVVQHFCTSK